MNVSAPFSVKKIKKKKNGFLDRFILHFFFTVSFKSSNNPNSDRIQLMIRRIGFGSNPTYDPSDRIRIQNSNPRIGFGFQIWIRIRIRIQKIYIRIRRIGFGFERIRSDPIRAEHYLITRPVHPLLWA